MHEELSCQFAWWPKLDADKGNMVKSCNICVAFDADPLPTVLHPCMGMANIAIV